jgi:hypothetical protein
LRALRACDIRPSCSKWFGLATPPLRLPKFKELYHVQRKRTADYE